METVSNRALIKKGMNPVPTRFPRWLLPVLGLLCCALFLCSAPADAEEELIVSLPAVVKGYTPCEIRITAPAAGEAVLRLYDRLNNPWLIRRETLSAGENVLQWDGLGANQERLMAGPYHFLVKMPGSDGKELTAKVTFEINGTTQTLVYALPSSETLYLDGQEKWFVECCTSAECIVVMEVRDGETLVYTREITDGNPDGFNVSWSGALDARKKIAPGDYTVTLWSKLNPDWKCSFPLHVRETCETSREIRETGPVIPDRGMTDEEIWSIMMQPSVVINANGKFRRFSLYERPNSSSRPVASLRCATQALEVLGVEGNWAHVRAWDHDGGQSAEGYYLVKKLTVYTPSPHYGILIDKRDQTLTVFHDGERVGTVPVSTGLVVGAETYRETPPGAFLTDVHIGPSFAQEGYRYEYPLRYDAGNMIHGLGYVRQNAVRDYSNNLPLLGQKASHGCTRVSMFATENCPINMYWLWIRLPYHTRVIVLDD